MVEREYIEPIRYGNKVVARIIYSQSLEGPFKFFTKDEDNLQIARWNHPKGYQCKPHIHNVLAKTIHIVHEAIFVLRGELLVTFYTPEGKPICERILREFDICHSMSCGHGYKVLTDDTKVVEFKNGPFMGDKEYDKERTLIDPNNFYSHEQV
jgi:hypothetical protein